MATRTLSAGELQRLRYELGANVLNVGAEPYVPHQRIFDVIAANLTSDAQDPAVSATSVAAAGSVTLTLDSVAGLSAGTPVVLDTDDAYERVSVQRVAGSTITVRCARAHTAPFPVEIESGLTLVRAALWRLAVLDRLILDAASGAGIKAVDEVQFFGPADGRSPLDELRRAQAAHRRELASLVNLDQVLDALGFGRGGASLVPY